jgi:tetratricopeptide (TPR) repeat protein
MKSHLLLILIFTISLTSAFSQFTNRPDTLTSDEAIKYFTTIVKRNKNSPFANFALANVYFARGDYRMAIKTSKRNTKYTNDYQAASYSIFAASLDRLGKTSTAIDVFEEALKLFPDNDQLLYQYSFSCYKQREFKKALPAIEKSITLHPLYVPAHYLYGCLLFENANDRRCISAFLFSLFLDNDSSRLNQAIDFVMLYMNHKLDDIIIPYHEQRLLLSSVDQIVTFYVPKKTRNVVRKNFKMETTLGNINDYIEAQKGDIMLYDNFFKSLREQHFTKTFGYYTLRMVNDSYIKIWLKNNGRELDDFAKFLGKTLPGK